LEENDEEGEKFVRPDFLAINTYKEQILNERRISFTSKISKKNSSTNVDENEFAIYDVPQRKDKNIF